MAAVPAKRQRVYGNPLEQLVGAQKKSQKKTLNPFSSYLLKDAPSKSVMAEGRGCFLPILDGRWKFAETR
jgi:hypothetical protein